MQRYFINIYNDADVMDEEGGDYADIGAARDVAIRGARAMMAEHVIAGQAINRRHRVEIADVSGRIVAVIPFGEIITVIN